MAFRPTYSISRNFLVNKRQFNEKVRNKAGILAFSWQDAFVRVEALIFNQ
jgi:hypothetical protein